MDRYRTAAAYGFLLSAMAQAAHADTLSSIPTPLLPTVKCIYSVLKSSAAVRSVDVYVIDGFSFGFEYAFTGIDGKLAVSDVELVVPSPAPAFLGDKIPREVTERAMMAGSALESDLNLSQKCHLHYAFDNLLPPPTARATWRRVDLPKDF